MKNVGPLSLILDASTHACFALARTVGSLPDNVIAVAVTLFIALFVPAHYLTVVNEWDRLAISCGPVPRSE